MADFKEIQIGEDGQVYQVKDETARQSTGGCDGTVTAVKMNNGSPIEPDENGVVNLGTVITQHQDVSNKVDKETGKGLSTNDYTTAEKAKLAGLSNYNDTQIQAAIDALQSAIDALTGVNDTTEVINTMNEVVNFLAGVTNDETLTGKLNELRTLINGKVDKETGKGLSANDYTTAEKTKLAGIQSGAEVNPTFATINGSRIDQGGNIQVVGAQGPKGDTGNVQVDGNGNVLIVNNLDDGGTGAALSAEMGKRLALKAGTYAGAWARSKVVIVPFCWLWQEQVGGSAICKPIWHIGNSVFIDAAGGVVSVHASAIPATPTFSETSGSTVGKGTELTITPDTDSALYYKIDNGAWNISDVAVTIEINATSTVTAKCVNNAGSSSEEVCSLTVSGPQAPSFAAAQGTTIGTGDVVSRGGSVVVSVPQGGELHYSTDGTNYTTASGLSVTIPVPAAGVHIYAYNVQDGDTSAIVDHNYTMAALATPTLTMSATSGDPTKPNEFPAGGGTVEITGPAGASIYYTLDGSTPTDQSTLYSGPISVTEGKTIKAIAKDGYGYSDVTTETYTVPVDHKLQFKIKLTGDNSTEYVPVTGNNGPQYHFTVDWGDNTPQETIGAEGAPVGKANKSVGHQYTGTAGTEFTITLRGTSIPVLVFNNATNGCCNIGALSAIVDNTLDCDTNFYGGFAACTGLESICANALQNNTYGVVSFRDTALTSLPDGLLSHLTKSGVNLTSCFRLFQNTQINVSQSQVNELKAAISHVTNFEAMFYGFLGSFAFPDDFFDGISADTITTLENMTHNAGAHVSGDAKKLYDSLVSRVKSNATTTRAFNATGLSNRSQVPTTWGGTMS